ncbi:Cyclic nucleotide-gated channel rod photoreceptor subunit alpha [Araneus ventricosus]|uniref:Cyclic nucleotide-gated channel rod photoreceptor subunit alpha n=1 Tax=Araneus ventricosus TaxID=182803 RepID=A0A4Y2N6W3_ARAVE|nr:Cyclic nucleotide-gated channel rod photoreceptor subunit alpha [Araneus ventricosus]
MHVIPKIPPYPEVNKVMLLSTLIATPSSSRHSTDLDSKYYDMPVYTYFPVDLFMHSRSQVGTVITNRNASRLEFERLLDGAKLYMRHHKVPRNMQRRVQRWYDYSWSRGRMQGGGDINSALGILPDKLKTELALHVNLKTLKKRQVVVIGQDVDLLILPTAFTPDYMDIHVLKEGKGKIKDWFYSSKDLRNSNLVIECKKSIFLLHAISGCDTTSGLYGKVKLQAVQLFNNSKYLQEIPEIFNNPK